MKTRKIYCIHNWDQHEYGSAADVWRDCNRCGTRWDSLKTKDTNNDVWPWRRGIYGKEPSVAIGMVKI